MRRRATAFLVLLVLAAGCGNASTGVRSRKLATGLLIGLFAVSAGATAATAVVGNDKEKKLREDVEAHKLNGHQFAERDAEGKNWNRAARGSVFVAGLALVGLVLVGEMRLSDRNQYGPVEPAKAPPIIPGEAPQTPAAALPGADRRPLTAGSASAGDAQRSATAR
jgi:hypothetical protein